MPAPVGAAGASADSEFLCPCRGKLHPTRVPRVPRRSASPTVAPPVATFLRPSGADPRRSHTRSEIAALRHRIRRNENCRQVRIFNRLRPVHSEKAGRQRVPADAGATQESRNASFCPRGTVRAASPKTFRCPKKFRELSAVIARLLGNDDVRRREQAIDVNHFTGLANHDVFTADRREHSARVPLRSRRVIQTSATPDSEFFYFGPRWPGGDYSESGESRFARRRTPVSAPLVTSAQSLP